MFCKHCGKEISDNALMCPDCGEPTGTVAKNKSAQATVNESDRTHCGRTAEFGFGGSLISFVSWIFYLVILVCGLRYATITGIVLGIFTGAVCLVSLFLSVKGIFDTESDSKERTIAIVGTVISATMLLGFLLLSCIYGALA